MNFIWSTNIRAVSKTLISLMCNKKNLTSLSKFCLFQDISFSGYFIFIFSKCFVVTLHLLKVKRLHVSIFSTRILLNISNNRS